MFATLVWSHLVYSVVICWCCCCFRLDHCNLAAPFNQMACQKSAATKGSSKSVKLTVQSAIHLGDGLAIAFVLLLVVTSVVVIAIVNVVFLQAATICCPRCHLLWWWRRRRRRRHYDHHTDRYTWLFYFASSSVHLSQSS